MTGPNNPAPDSAAKMQEAVDTVGALSPDSTPSVLAAVVGNLDTAAQQQKAASAAVGALTREGQEEVLSTVLGIPPDAKTQRTLWYVVIATISATIFVFGIFACVLLLNDDKHAEAPLALATTALGGVVGLIAPSPIKSQQH